jgi:hypothetical protein
MLLARLILISLKFFWPLRFLTPSQTYNSTRSKKQLRVVGGGEWREYFILLRSFSCVSVHTPVEPDHYYICVKLMECL